jgi:nucleotide-binding universal stress UspA family protein
VRSERTGNDTGRLSNISNFGEVGARHFVTEIVDLPAFVKLTILKEIALIQVCLAQAAGSRQDVKTNRPGRREKRMFKHLLVPTDGSALSEAAIQMAVTLARENEAKLTGLHVIPEFHVLAHGTEMIADTEDQFIQVTRQHADDYLMVITKAATQAGIECDTVTRNRAHPYEAIISVAAQRNCDLIVMASHGRSGMRALLLGSETQKVLTHCQIPVLVVREPTQTGAGRVVESSTPSTESKPSPPQTYIVARALFAVIPVRVSPPSPAQPRGWQR